MSIKMRIAAAAGVAAVLGGSLTACGDIEYASPTETGTVINKIADLNGDSNEYSLVIKQTDNGAVAYVDVSKQLFNCWPLMSHWPGNPRQCQGK